MRWKCFNRCFSYPFIDLNVFLICRHQSLLVELYLLLPSWVPQIKNNSFCLSINSIWWAYVLWAICAVSCLSIYEINLCSQKEIWMWAAKVGCRLQEKQDQRDVLTKDFFSLSHTIWALLLAERSPKQKIICLKNCLNNSVVPYFCPKKRFPRNFKKEQTKKYLIQLWESGLDLLCCDLYRRSQFSIGPLRLYLKIVTWVLWHPVFGLLWIR